MGSDEKNLTESRGGEGDNSLFGRMRDYARLLPGADVVEERYQNLEERALRQLKSRLADIDDRRLPAPPGYKPLKQSLSRGLVSSSALLEQHPKDIMADLLERSENQTTEQAELYLYSNMLRELVPDEARLLRGLSDGASHPLVHIGMGPPIGPVTRRVEGYFTFLGKSSTLRLKEYTPMYLAHLHQLELIELGPEDKELEIRYQVLEGDRAIRERCAAIETPKGMTTRFIRRVVRISELGAKVWALCDVAPTYKGIEDQAAKE
ncbi:MAG: Abi-alpha family protein [Salinisphaeraceae bacterium]|nr:Abi-alpha family protein [Salinisphaeraceae bacterium]